MNADKPSGLELDDFLPKKMQGLGLDHQHLAQAQQGPAQAPSSSRFSAYKDYGSPSDLSESEVTSTILKGHESMMAVLATRGRSVEIVHKLWQNKDAKTGVYCMALCCVAVWSGTCLPGKAAKQETCHRFLQTYPANLCHIPTNIAGVNLLTGCSKGFFFLSHYRNGCPWRTNAT